VPDLFGGLDPDDQARLLDRLPATLADRLLATLPVRLRATTLRLVGYPPESAGRAMNTAVVSVHAAQSVATALADVRAVGAAAETVYMLPVFDADDTVVGVVSMRRLLFSRPDSHVGEVMSSPATRVSAGQDQEEADKLVRTARLIAAPVVDSSGHLLGVLTVDDAMRILEEADDEDFARGAGSRSLPGSSSWPPR
jgi:magnesium transporter